MQQALIGNALAGEIAGFSPNEQEEAARFIAEIAYKRRSQTLILAGTVVPRIETNLGLRVAGKIVARSVDVALSLTGRLQIWPEGWRRRRKGL